MLQRLAMTLGFGEALLHIETVTPTGAMLQADPAMAIECLTKACQAASLPGVRSIILGGAGLAGLASLIQPHVELPLIDSVQAGLRVLIKGEAPQPIRSANGFVARLNHLSPAMLRLAD
jgi:Asp/Glu/hydantoin racemase